MPCDDESDETSDAVKLESETVPLLPKETEIGDAASFCQVAETDYTKVFGKKQSKSLPSNSESKTTADSVKAAGSDGSSLPPLSTDSDMENAATTRPVAETNATGVMDKPFLSDSDKVTSNSVESPK